MKELSEDQNVCKRKHRALILFIIRFRGQAPVRASGKLKMGVKCLFLFSKSL